MKKQLSEDARKAKTQAQAIPNKIFAESRESENVAHSDMQSVDDDVMLNSLVAGIDFTAVATLKYTDQEFVAITETDVVKLLGIIDSGAQEQSDCNIDQTLAGPQSQNGLLQQLQHQITQLQDELNRFKQAFSQQDELNRFKQAFSQQQEDLNRFKAMQTNQQKLLEILQQKQRQVETSSLDNEFNDQMHSTDVIDSVVQAYNTESVNNSCLSNERDPDSGDRPKMILRLKRSEVPSEAQQWQVVESSIPKRTYTQRVVQHSEEDSQKKHTCRNGYTKKEGVVRLIHNCDVENCNSTFTTAVALKNHKLIHAGIKPHKCNLCKKSFRLKHYLSEHMRIHTGEKPLLCKICNMSFRQRAALYQHKKTHIEYDGMRNQSYSCDYCRKILEKKYLSLHCLKCYPKTSVGTLNKSFE